MTHPYRALPTAHLASFALALTLAVSGAVATAPAAPHFDYRHQEQWQEIHGDMQSPIAVDPAVAKTDTDDDDDDRIVVRHGLREALVVDTGHAVQVNLTPGESANIRSRRFVLQQFHFHAPSEHSIDGRSFPLEGHFVYRAKDGRLAVVAVMFEAGAPNEVAELVLSRFASGRADIPVRLDAEALLPSTVDYYHYLGSLTTPPLSQNVEWYVLTRPMTMSAAQIAGFKALYDGNNRKRQPLNGRPLLHFTQD
jgi:carbonic anhydrase